MIKCPHQSLKWHPPSESLLKALNASLKWFSGSWTHTNLCQVSTRCVVIDGHLIARFFLHKVVKGREVKDSSVVLVNVVDHILRKFQRTSWILDASWFAVLCQSHGPWLTLWDRILSYCQQNQDDRTYIERLTSWKVSKRVISLIVNSGWITIATSSSSSSSSSSQWSLLTIISGSVGLRPALRIAQSKLWVSRWNSYHLQLLMRLLVRYKSEAPVS